MQLMDRLCSLSSQTESSSSEKQTKKQKVAIMAWAAFQVLANRCVEWEKEEGRRLAGPAERARLDGESSGKVCVCVCGKPPCVQSFVQKLIDLLDGKNQSDSPAFQPPW